MQDGLEITLEPPYSSHRFEIAASYSPDYNPIEYLWKKAKTPTTHNHYFDEFVKLVASVETALEVLTTQVNEILRLMGVFTNHPAGYATT